ncbi:MAG TPA: replicative DNA helicase [Candidatus Lambdaproteobacteria bacterium]|nr:replicative DNA helicase [Candidatus Lambdaproteobacteria bacterium]HIA58020.1 replicative DNA helicase [Candidatus Lambdaproteobacteria bacterium]HIB45687.1 replicative DNA helicase [Candidatus Lambdaproteobacteria bacterium]HIB93752.1 replicative DNA helicase [Candidatus Lambdaproteobacteria bacterium]HIN48617.1 replicative DNA helicase [Deltaproteobacteria bacterium]
MQSLEKKIEKSIVSGRSTKTRTQAVDLGELLPHDKLAEQAVLGAIIIQNSVLLQILDILNSEDFFSPANQLIFAAMQEMAAQEPPIPIDELTLLSRLESRQQLEQTGGVDYLNELSQKTPVAENAEFYARIVREKGQLRDIILTAHEVAKRGQEGSADNISDFIADATERLQSIDARTRLRSYTHLKEILASNFEQLEKISESPENVTGVPTGFTELDDLTRGLQKGDLIILAGRPSMGKTALAINMALYAAGHAQIPSLIFSLEMPKEHIAMRLICSEAKVNNRKLLVGNLEQEDWDKLMEGTTRMMEAPLLVDDRSSINPNYIRQVIRQAVKEYPDLGLVIVDYVQLMQSNLRNPSREQEISEISRSLKGIAKEFSLPMVVLSQLNRALERRTEKRPMMSDLRESGALEQDADLIVFIYRDEVYNPDTEDKGIAEINIAKHRNGEIGMKRLAFIGQYTKFANLALGSGS